MNIWEVVIFMILNWGGLCVVFDKYLYVIGGKIENDNLNDLFKYLNMVEKYDFRINIWIEVMFM